MDLTPFVDRLRGDLADAAAAGGADTRATAERLLLALDPATRMVLLEALSQAASEISGELDHDAVEVRLAGREPEFVVTHVAGDLTEPTMPLAPPPPPPPPAPPEAPEEPDSPSRITLRLPESIKTRAEDAAAEAGQSVNAWLVDAVRDALDGGRVDLRFGNSSLTIQGDRVRSTGRHGKGGRIQGWVD